LVTFDSENEETEKKLREVIEKRIAEKKIPSNYKECFQTIDNHNAIILPIIKLM